MNNPISKLSGKHLSLYRFCNNKSNTSTWLIGSISDIVGQFKNIFLKMQFKFQCIQRISFIPSTVKIGLKKCLGEIGLKGQLLEGQRIHWHFSGGYVGVIGI